MTPIASPVGSLIFKSVFSPVTLDINLHIQVEVSDFRVLVLDSIYVIFSWLIVLVIFCTVQILLDKVSVEKLFTSNHDLAILLIIAFIITAAVFLRSVTETGTFSSSSVVFTQPHQLITSNSIFPNALLTMNNCLPRPFHIQLGHLDPANNDHNFHTVYISSDMNRLNFYLNGRGGQPFVDEDANTNVIIYNHVCFVLNNSNSNVANAQFQLLQIRNCVNFQMPRTIRVPNPRAHGDCFAQQHQWIVNMISNAFIPSVDFTNAEYF